MNYSNEMAEQSWDALTPARRARIGYWLQAVDSTATVEQVEQQLEALPAYQRLAAQWSVMSDEQRLSSGAGQLDELFKTAAYASRPYCKRCGTCCRKAGPSLYPGDDELLRTAVVSRDQLQTLRAGERVFSHFTAKPEVLRRECVSLAAIAGVGCCSYVAEDRGCRIYANRPQQCRVQRCWDTSEAEALLSQPTLTRRDLLPENDPLQPAIERHEQVCPPERLHDMARAAQNGDSSVTGAIALLVQADRAARQQLVDAGLATQRNLRFALGTPLEAMLAPYGLQIAADHDGSLAVKRRAR